VIAVDIGADKLRRAAELGAEVTFNSREVDVVAAIREVTGGGAHLSLDALGHAQTCTDSILCLRTQGRHVQVGLLVADHGRPRLPMEAVIARELTIHGSHGMAAHAYPEMLGMIESGLLRPDRLIGARLTLQESVDALTGMDSFSGTGVQVIDRFGQDAGSEGWRQKDSC
jgi:alcohol dehydrogenase